MDLLFFFFVACALPWLIIGWFRIPRYARYFQLEGYESERYLRWLARHKGEQRNFIIGIGAWIVLFAANFLRFGVPLSSLIAITSISLVLAIVTIVLAPRDTVIKQKFGRTSRAIRLLITAYLVELIPLVVASLFLGGLWSWGADTRNSPEATGIFLMGFLVLSFFVVALTGVTTYLLTPLALPLANVILWPVEEAFRRYYLRLAKQHLKRSGATVIAITGSYGKTSTKHYLNHILGGRFRVLMTPKSYNTLLGVSRVINDILAKDVSYDYFIVEAGAYIPGEIARICQLVEPQISMVITVGPMHLERFGSIENVVKAKYEIIESLPPDGVGVFNADDPRVHGMAERGYPETRILITRQGASDAWLSATNVQMIAEGLAFDVRDNATGEQASMRAPLYGEHNVTNILMAMAVARHLGMSFPEIAMRVATLEPAEHRLHRQVLPDGTVIIDDAYSANPVGTQTALQVLALQNNKPDARRIVLSAGMFELGPISDEENRKLGERMAGVATDVILIGSAQTKPVQEGLASKHFPPDHLHVVNTLNEAVTIYRSLLRPGDALLVLTDLPDVYA